MQHWRRQSALVEARLIVETLADHLPTRFDGRQAIIDMKNSESRQWRQMEWIAFYVEHLAEPVLNVTLGGRSGPQIGNTRFDYQREFVWDLKAHPNQKANGKPNDESPLNDALAIRECASEYHGVGFVIVHGNAEFDDSGEFKLWHDDLKGSQSKYETERIRRGSWSRRRKTAFDITQIDAVFLSSTDEIDQAVSDHWLRPFQTGMRNSDGTPRRMKYKMVTPLVPDWAILASAYPR